MIDITIYTEPVAQERPRFTRINGYPRAYDPPKSKQAKAIIQQRVCGVVKEPIQKPISLTVRFYRSLTKELERQVRKGLKNMPILADKRPDLDNYIKLLKDALNGIFWVDDSLIVKLEASKFYDEVPRIEIHVQEIADDVENNR